MYLDGAKPEVEEKKKKKPEPEKITPFKKIGYEDMTKMEDMDLDGVLANLKERYENELIYVRRLPPSLPASLLLSQLPLSLAKYWLRSSPNGRPSNRRTPVPFSWPSTPSRGCPSTAVAG